MPKIAPALSDAAVRKLSHSGSGRRTLHSVGGAPGLALQCLSTGGRTWLLRYAEGKARKELRLGNYPDVSLKEARSLAHLERSKIDAGRDPAQERREARAARSQANKTPMTFAVAVEEFLSFKLAEFQNAKHRAQWRSTLDQYAIPVLGSLPVSEINNLDVLNALQPIWTTKTETATRLRGRIERVMAYAIAKGEREPFNPAVWRGNLDALLPSPAKLQRANGVVHQPAVGLKDLPAWFAALRGRSGMAPRALEFAVLTAARSGEVRGAAWNEVDLETGTWTIPAQRMKARREHRVALSDTALRLLRLIPRQQKDAGNTMPDLIFWAPRGGPLSDMALSAVMRRMQADQVAKGHVGWLDPRSQRPAVPHGLRSSFRDWCGEHTDYPRELAEHALAHNVGSEVERAYSRGDLLEKRRVLMEDWARYIGADDGRSAIVGDLSP